MISILWGDSVVRDEEEDVQRAQGESPPGTRVWPLQILPGFSCRPACCSSGSFFGNHESIDAPSYLILSLTPAPALVWLAQQLVYRGYSITICKQTDFRYVSVQIGTTHVTNPGIFCSRVRKIRRRENDNL